MGSQMTPQIAALRELSITMSTFKRFLSGMSSKMSCKIAALKEFLSTDAAVKFGAKHFSRANSKSTLRRIDRNQFGFDYPFLPDSACAGEIGRIGRYIA